MLETQPQVYRKQGLFTGIVDNLAESLVKYGSQGQAYERIKSFSEFQQEFITYDNNRKKVAHPFSQVAELFLNFHPKTMPILWRILLVQVMIYEAMKKTREQPKTKTDIRTLRLMSKEDLQKYDWRTPEDHALGSEKDDKTYDAIREYLLTRENLKDS
jgi:hypothetical protein